MPKGISPAEAMSKNSEKSLYIAELCLTGSINQSGSQHKIKKFKISFGSV